jgi:hypothetical protein
VIHDLTSALPPLIRTEVTPAFRRGVSDTVARYDAGES